MISALIFVIVMMIITLGGLRFILTPVVRVFFLMYGLATIIMIALPAVWHAWTDFNQIGFLGFQFDPKNISNNVLFIYLATAYVYAMTFTGFVVADRIFSRVVVVQEDGAKWRAQRQIILIVFLILVLLYFDQYYGKFAELLLMRARDAVNLPIYFELLRGAVVAACTYSTLKLATTRPTHQPFEFALTLIVFLASLAITAGFGTRNLLVYPIIAILLTLILPGHSDLLRRNLFLGGLLLALFLGLTLVQSNFRDSGIGGTAGVELSVADLFLAFDQFNALYITFETVDSFQRPANRHPLSLLTDLFLYFIPRGWFELLGIEKLTHVNYLAWNAFVTGPVHSNVTPSYIGQAWIEGGILGLFLLPVNIMIFLMILLKIIAVRLRRDRDLLSGLTLIALCAGTLFNFVRMMSGIYVLYVFVFVGVMMAVNVGAALMARTSR